MKLPIQTLRLILTEFTSQDSAFILKLLNEPSFIQNIGDRKVRTLEDANNYIQTRLIASYKANGFGLYRVSLLDGTTVGMCGLVKRDPSEDPDIGFAFLPEYFGQGYAKESSLAVLDYAKNSLGLKKVLGITIPSNIGSIKTLESIGLKFLKMSVSKDDGSPIKVYSITL